MSIILGAISGAGQGLARVGQMGLEKEYAADLMGQRADLEEAKAKSLAEYQNTMQLKNQADARARISQQFKDKPNLSADDALRSGDLETAKYLADRDNKAQLLDIKQNQIDMQSKYNEARGQMLEATAGWRNALADSADRKAAAEEAKRNNQVLSMYDGQFKGLAKEIQTATDSGDMAKIDTLTAQQDALYARMNALRFLSEDTQQSPAKIDLVLSGIQRRKVTPLIRNGKLYAPVGDGKAMEIPEALYDQLGLQAPVSSTPTDMKPATKAKDPVSQPIIQDARRGPSLTDLLLPDIPRSSGIKSKPATSSPAKTSAPGRYNAVTNQQ